MQNARAQAPDAAHCARLNEKKRKEKEKTELIKK